MELRILYGAHQSAQEQLRAHLEQNRDLLAEQGTFLPEVGVAEVATNQAIRALRNGKATDQTKGNLLSQLSEDKPYERILVIRAPISGTWRRPTKEGIFYPRGGSTIAQLTKLLGPETIKLYFATRNPASFLPSCYNLVVQNKPDQTFRDYANQSDPFDLRWSEYLHRVQGKDSELPVTVWSYEDFPYIWRSVAQAFSGIANKEDLIPAPDNVQQEMSLKGALLMYAYLVEHPTNDQDQLLKIAEKFIQKFPEVIGESIADIWPEELVTGLTNAYDDDNYYIDRMENVHTIRRPVYP